MPKSEIRCETPRCMEAIVKYGENYHGVYEQKISDERIERGRQAGAK